ncbi:MAG TPA: LpqB family beta-propeller domain-containing protein [Ruania sp.]|nr:LpqB family beta-propeller domain-containing protein [Ruania sp.]
MRGKRALIAVLTALVLAGCGSLPTSGPVEPGVEAAPDEGVGYVVADDPHTGDTPSQIVRGFQSAAVAGIADDFSTARKFLSQSAKGEWDPAAQVVIYDGAAPLAYSKPDDESVKVSATVVATVDENGVYTAAAPGTTTTLSYELARNAAGEWRISELPDGVLMSEVNFGTLYRKTPLYFLTADADTLVPDVRWYPQRNSATYAVRGLLAGASEWLAPAVISAVPTGTELSIDSVTVTGGTATVPLTSAVQTASAEDRALLVGQIEATLTALPQVQSVQITVGDVPLEVNATIPPLEQDPGVGRTLTLLTAGDRLATFNGSEVVPNPDSVPLDPLDPSDPAVPLDSNLPEVMLAGDSRVVTAPTTQSSSDTLVQGKQLLAPSYGPKGWIWTAEQNNTGQLVLARPDGQTKVLPAPSLDGVKLRALRVSRDGTRLALIAATDESVEVSVHAITIDDHGEPGGLGPALRVGRILTDATDVVWVGESTLAVLGVSKTNETVHEVEVGGRTTALPSVEGTVDIAAGRGMRNVYLTTSDGRLFGRSGNGWAVVADGVHDPTFPG